MPHDSEQGVHPFRQPIILSFYQTSAPCSHNTLLLKQRTLIFTMYIVINIHRIYGISNILYYYLRKIYTEIYIFLICNVTEVFLFTNGGYCYSVQRARRSDVQERDEAINDYFRARIIC